MTEKSIKNKAIKGTVWSAADAFLGQGVTFIVGIVLARLLTPDEYGLIGIITIFITILTGIVDVGFSNALIRKLDATDDDYNTMFFTNLMVSIVSYVLLYVGAPYIASFFGKSELVLLIRVMGLILIVQALSLTHITILTKKLDFKTKTKASLISAILSGLIGIGMALAGCGVWALVGQQLSRIVFYSLILWCLVKWIPSLRFSKQSFKYLWGFGWKLLVSGILSNTWNQLYQVVVGKFYSSTTLGQYSRSRQFAGLFSENITAILQRVTYPVLSEIQDDKTRMVSAYRRIIKISMLITANAMIILGAISEPFIYCLIGPQWKEAATYLPLICISLSLYPLHAINLNMLQVLGRSDIFLYIEIIKKVLSIGPILLGIFVSIYWMLIASILTGIISFFLNSYYTGKLLHYTSWMQMKDVLPDYYVSFCIAVSIYFIKFLPLSYWLILPIQIIVGFVVGVVICEFIKLPEYLEIKEIVNGVVEKITKSNER